MVFKNLPFEDSTNISFDKDNRGAPGQGTGPEVSAAIPGDAWNQPFAGHMQFSTWRLLYLESILAVSA